MIPKGSSDFLLIGAVSQQAAELSAIADKITVTGRRANIISPMLPQPHNLETDSRFPSGEWVGFFLQPSISRDRRRMELSLTFSSGRDLTSEGRDGVGDFTIRGRYDTKTGEVTFHKNYISQHSVFLSWLERREGHLGNVGDRRTRGRLRLLGQGRVPYLAKGDWESNGGEFAGGGEGVGREVEEVVFGGGRLGWAAIPVFFIDHLILPGSEWIE